MHYLISCLPTECTRRSILRLALFLSVLHNEDLLLWLRIADGRGVNELRALGENPVSFIIFPPQIPLEMFWVRSWGSVMTGHWLTNRNMARNISC